MYGSGRAVCLCVARGACALVGCAVDMGSESVFTTRAADPTLRECRYTYTASQLCCQDVAEAIVIGKGLSFDRFGCPLPHYVVESRKGMT